MNLNDYFYLNRAGRYSDPLNTNDRLPIVYGDLTGETNGIWILPCLNAGNNVYCYADHAVLSAVDGNTIRIFEDGMELNPVLYVFDESDDYEGHGVISTINFTSPKGNSIITAQGQGKVLTGTTLMDNIIDIIYDFLTVENSFSSTIFESTSKAKAKSIFTAQSYKGAGVICRDTTIWEILQQMIGSFYGSCFLNSNKELVLTIDDGLLSQYANAGIIPRSQIEIKQVIQRDQNLINQCPASFSYNYVVEDFSQHTDSSTAVNTISQNIYGVQTPTSPYRHYFCRDLTSIQKIQGIIVNQFKNPLWEMEVMEYGAEHFHVDVGDLITATCEWCNDKNGNELINEIWKIISFNPNLDDVNLTIRTIDTGYFLTKSQLLDGSWILDGTYKLGGDRDLTDY